MITTITVEKEIEITAVRLTLPVRFGIEDMPDNFPFRTGDFWIATIDIDSGKVRDWPQGESGEFYMKVSDEGVYHLLGPYGEVLARKNDYVPDGLIPGEYGDYVHLKINRDGIVENWPKNPSVSEFFPTP